METRLISYLPPVLQNIEEFKALYGTEDYEIDDLYAALEILLKDQFVHEATENGIKRWEKILKIIPGASDTLDMRRFEILNRLNIKIPYTITMLRNKIQALYGSDCDIKYINDTYTLKIFVPAIVDKELLNLQKMLDVIIPANYDTLKYVAQVVLPSVGTLYFALAGIWGLPFGEEIVGTITAIDAFLGALLMISTSQYKKAKE